MSLVKLRLSAEAHLVDELTEAFDALKNLLKPIMVYEGDFKPEEMLHTLFTKHGLTLSVAESCTGGHIAARLTAVSGCSAYFRGGFIPYATEAKHEVVGVPNETLLKAGVVSAETAELLAEHTRIQFKSDYAISVTGYLEQGDHNNEVWLGFCNAHNTMSIKITVPYDREKNTQLVVNSALTMLYKWVVKQSAT